MAWGSVPISSFAEGLGSNGGTSSTSIDTTGADTIFLVIGYANSGALSVSDSKSNTWIEIASSPRDSGSGHRGAMYYAKSAIVGTGHTFTVTGTSDSIAISVSAWSGGHATAPEDNSSSNSGLFGSTTSPGSVTPSVANCLMICGVSHTDNGSDISSIAGFTLDQHAAAGPFNFGAGIGYLLETSAAAQNPLCTINSSVLAIMALLCAFKPSAGGATPDTLEWMPKSQQAQLAQNYAPIIIPVNY